MKYISLKDLENEIYVFDESDKLCPRCSYPLDIINPCLGCTIFHAEKNKGVTGGKIYFDKILSVGTYSKLKKSEKPAKQSKDIMNWLVYSYKKDEKYIPFCVELLKTKILNFLAYSGKSISEVILCAMPDHPKEVYKKADLLAENLAKELNLEFSPILNKTRETRKQHNLNLLKEKFENVKGAYSVNEQFLGKIKDKTVFLIDDVVTSMATTNECSRILKDAGAKEIFVFSLGRTVLPEKKEGK